MQKDDRVAFLQKISINNNFVKENDIRVIKVFSCIAAYSSDTELPKCKHDMLNPSKNISLQSSKQIQVQ